MSRDKVYQACQELLEEGQSISVRAVIDKVGGSARDVAPVVKDFKESLEKELEKESNLAVSEKANLDSQRSGNQDDYVNADPVAANLDRVDREAQLIAARKVISTAYYEKTKEFSLPGLKQEVNQTLKEIDSLAAGVDETLSPKGMLEWLKAKQHH